MIVLKKLTASLTLLNLGIHEYWRSSRDYELSHKIHPFISISQCKSLWIFQKRRGDRSQMYCIFEKDGDTHESEAREKPQKP